MVLHSRARSSHFAISNRASFVRSTVAPLLTSSSFLAATAAVSRLSLSLPSMCSFTALTAPSDVYTAPLSVLMNPLPRTSTSTPNTFGKLHLFLIHQHDERISAQFELHLNCTQR